MNDFLPIGLKFKDRGPAVAENDVVRLESTLGYSLPSDYRQFLLHINGGTPNRCWLRLGDIRSEGLACFYSLNSEDEYSDIGYWAVDENCHWPRPMLPVGDDPGGNLILLELSGSDKGTVHFWDHEYGCDPATNWARALSKVSGSFTELLWLLTEEESSEARTLREDFRTLVAEGRWKQALDWLSLHEPEPERLSTVEWMLRLAASRDDFEGVALLLPQVEHLYFCVMDCVREGRAEILDTVLRSGCQQLVNERFEPFGFTLLHDAANTNHVRVAQVLLDHGADINAKSFHDLTPLKRADMVGKKEMVAFLRSKGAVEN